MPKDNCDCNHGTKLALIAEIATKLYILKTQHH